MDRTATAVADANVGQDPQRLHEAMIAQRTIRA
jgi:hypothetical protein